MDVVASVIVCTRNRCDVLGECIESLLDQAVDAYEIIVVNDGSTDETTALLSSYGDTITAVDSDGVGPGMARNAGVAIARGDNLFFIDDDATAPAGWIDGMIAVANDTKAALLCGGAEPYSMEDRYERYMHYRMQTSLGPVARSIKAGPTMNMLVRTDVFRAVGGFREERLEAAEDWDLCLKIGGAGHRIYYTPDPAVVHRYQTDAEGVKRRITAGSRAGVHIAKDHYSSVLAYTAYSVLRFLWSPLTIVKAYPADLWGFAYRMEFLFCRERIAAYVRTLLGGSAV